jgi:D-hydroxyproline dehydrogenase subunit alpha
MSQPDLRVTVVGAGRLGCDLALAAQAAGHRVTLIDEHPQTMGQMSFDAPWFYGAALPGALANENAIAQSVLENSPQLVACFEAGIDVRVASIAWGAFQNGPNSQHVGSPKVGLVDGSGNSMLDHDVLLLATGARDFVPAFKGADLPGVFGVKAGVALLDLYACYEGRKTLVLGTSTAAVDFVRRATARGVRIVGMIEQGQEFQAGLEAEAEVVALGVPVYLGRVILAAEGRQAVASAQICLTGGGDEISLPCDSICLALGVLPNIELPAAMGCDLRFDPALGSWLPETDAAGRTSFPGVFYLSGFAASDVGVTLSAVSDPAAATQTLTLPASSQGRYLRDWIAALRQTGGGAVTLCKCEEISRDAFLGLRPPPYLGAEMRQAQSPVAGFGTGPSIHQDQVKRMTRVGMGHCQGKRCRDEAAILLSLQFGIGLPDIRPGSYRFPVRPINLDLMAAPDDTPDTREKWSYWLHPSPRIAE